MSELPSFFSTENKRESYKKQRQNKSFCNAVMPSEDTEILKFNQSQNSDKTPFLSYASLECLIEKTDKNNPENPSTTKVSEHIPLGFSMSTISPFKNIEIDMMYV